MLYVFTLLAIAILGAGLLCWTLALFKLVLGQPLVEWTPRRQVPWALVDLVAMVALYLAANIVAVYILRELGLLPRPVKLDELGLEERKTLALLNAVLSLAILAIGLPLIALRARSTLTDFGWSAREILGDIRLGAIAFAMLAPPVYAIQAILTQIWPSKHPLMEMFRESPDSTLFAVLVFAAVVVAPLTEELLFRVLLQGFLEKAFTTQASWYELFFGSSPGFARIDVERPDCPTDWQNAAPAWRPLEDDLNPYRAPAISEASDMEGVPVGSGLAIGMTPPGSAAAFWPIAISAAIFALLHFSHGPDWVPLIFLAAGMGYLYHRTHRLVPSLTVHALLNGLSMWGLWISVHEAPQL